LPYLLYLLFAIPIFFSYAYSYEKNLLAVALALVALLLACMLLWRGSSTLAAPRLRKAVFTAGCALLGGFQLARLISFYFQGESFNTQFFFHLELGNALQAWRAYLPLLLVSAGFMIAVITLGLRTRLQHVQQFSPQRMLLLVLLVTVLEPDILGYLRYRHEQAQDSYLEVARVEDAVLQAHYLDPAALDGRLGIVTPGKNLVLIYLEGLEASYFDTGIFGDLTPNLRRLRTQGLDFSNMLQTAGTGYTMAGIVATQCGTPLLFAAAPDGNDLLNNGFLNNVHCLGDVLERAGYEQVFVGGAGLDFSGKGQFFRDHRYDVVLGRDELAGRLAEPGYQTGWGLYDDSLLALAREEFTRLAAGTVPFNLTLLTLDTHHPTGEPSRSCPRYAAIDNSMLHAVHCSDHLVSTFLADLATHPAWENTVVVLVSDHYAMRNAAQQYYPPFDDRRLLFTILNGGEARTVARPGTLMDVAPTLLQVLDVGHNTGFLAGTSLLKDDTPVPSHAELTARERTTLISQLNSAVLTSKSVHLCAVDPLLTREPGRIRIAGRNIATSSLGVPLPEGSLRNTYTFVALWDSAGYLLSSMIVENAELPGLLYRFRGENFLTLGNANALPAYLKTVSAEVADKQGLVALLGNLLGEVRTLRIEGSGGTYVADSVACGNVVNTIAASADPAAERALLESWCAAEPGRVDTLNVETGVLQLNLVYFDGGWFEAELHRNAQGQFFPASYRALEVEGTENCYAQITETELVIPALRIGAEQQMLSLTRVPGDELLFELN
jgi:phosphoglycerol transferase